MDNFKIFNVYHLVDPDKTVFYVGLSSEPNKRLYAHVKGATRVSKHIKEIKYRGADVRMDLVFTGTYELCRQYEKNEIKRLYDSGIQLININDKKANEKYYQPKSSKKIKRNKSIIKFHEEQVKIGGMRSAIVSFLCKKHKVTETTIYKILKSA